MLQIMVAKGNLMTEHGSKVLEDDVIVLRELTEDDVGADYVSWMNDYSIVKYTESKFTQHSFDSIRKFVRSVNESENNQLFGIFIKENGRHVGNIKLGNIHPVYMHADIGLIIGLKEYWGKGIATKAIKMVTNYGFDALNLHKIFAGAYSINVGSIKAFQKCGYKIAYIKKDEVFFENNYVDCVYLEKFNLRHNLE